MIRKAVIPAWWAVRFDNEQSVSEARVLWAKDMIGKDFDIQTWDGKAWQTAKSVRGNAEVQSDIKLDAPVRTRADGGAGAGPAPVGTGHQQCRRRRGLGEWRDHVACRSARGAARSGRVPGSSAAGQPRGLPIGWSRPSSRIRGPSSLETTKPFSGGWRTTIPSRSSSPVTFTGTPGPNVARKA